jgi:hypothetical protein
MRSIVSEIRASGSDERDLTQSLALIIRIDAALAREATLLGWLWPAY